MKNTHITLSLMSAVLICTACNHHQTAAQIGQQKLASVNLSDGVSQSEAQLIADCYFAKNPSCGSSHGILDDGGRWKVIAVLAQAGVPEKSFYIDKQSGKIESLIGPSYDNPHEIFP